MRDQRRLRLCYLGANAPMRKSAVLPLDRPFPSPLDRMLLALRCRNTGSLGGSDVGWLACRSVGGKMRTCQTG